MRLPSLDVQSSHLTKDEKGGYVEPSVKSAPEPFVIFARDRNSPFTICIGQFLAAGIVMALTLWNCLGVKEGTWIQNIFTIAKTAGLLMVIVVGLFLPSIPKS